MARTEGGSAPSPETFRPEPAARPVYRVVRFNDPNAAIGVACRLMMALPAFAKLQFGAWLGVLTGQVDRGHYRIFINSKDAAVGFIGYGLCTEADAEAWAFHNAPLDGAKCQDGDCVVMNAWVAIDGTVGRAMVDEARRISGGRKAYYFKRFYADGRVRPVRLPRTAFHLPPA